MLIRHLVLHLDEEDSFQDILLDATFPYEELAECLGDISLSDNVLEEQEVNESIISSCGAGIGHIEHLRFIQKWIL